mmetsp:Transcript_32455/g.77966  ORF Transcript_32455/g.77966 Transcript_32455/m.77966 type:complete len:324 (-) Transcript_32455:70-1041(-)
MFVRGPSHGPRRDDLDRLLDGLNLLRPQSLPSLKIIRLGLACGRQVIQVLLIVITGGNSILKVTFGICLSLGRLRLLLRFVTPILLRRGDGIGQILFQHFKRVLGIRLFFLQLSTLIFKFIVQLLQNLNDARAVVFVRSSLRGTRPFAARQKNLQLAAFLVRHLDLQKRIPLFLVEHFLLDQSHSRGGRINALGHVLVRCQIVFVFHLSHLSRSFEITFVHTNILVQLGDLLGQLADVRLALADHGLQRFNLLVGFLDRPGLFDGCIITKLFVRRELHLLLMLLALSLLQHAIHQLDHFLNWRDLGSRRKHGCSCKTTHNSQK